MNIAIFCRFVRTHEWDALCQPVLPLNYCQQCPEQVTAVVQEGLAVGIRLVHLALLVPDALHYA